MKEKIKEKTVKLLSFPEELVFPRIVFCGNKSVSIENYKAIIEYESDRIRISTSEFLLQMKGRELEIGTIDDDQLQINGLVEEVEFLY